MSHYLQSLIEQGFDASYIARQGNQYGRTSYRPKCSQCETLVINGKACHETGCSHIVRDLEDTDGD